MKRAARISGKPDHWRRASKLWLHAEKPEKKPRRRYSGSRPPRSRGRLAGDPVQRAPGLDYIPAAAAAMEASAGLDPSNGDLAVKVIRLYRVAVAPV